MGRTRTKAGPDATKGAIETLAYLDRNEMTVPDLADLAEIDRVTLVRALKGETKSISVDFALKIKAATKGEIETDWWGELTPESEPHGLSPEH